MTQAKVLWILLSTLTLPGARFGWVFAKSEHDKESNLETSPSRIIGGAAATRQQVPYQLQLLFMKSKHRCGATLTLTPTFRRQIAITAAHCVVIPGTSELLPASLLTLNGGNVGLNETGQTLHISRIIIHPLYRAPDVRNDIAILRLRGRFDLNENLQPLSLPRQGQDTPDILRVSGWGATNSSNFQSSATVLQVIDLPVVNHTACRKWYEEALGQDIVTKNMICGGLEAGGKSGCVGDSGGPAMSTLGGRRYLTGVVSWATSVCEAPKRPTVFTKVSSYVSWITESSWMFDILESFFLY